MNLVRRHNYARLWDYKFHSEVYITSYTKTCRSYQAYRNHIVKVFELTATGIVGGIIPYIAAVTS